MSNGTDTKDETTNVPTVNISQSPDVTVVNLVEGVPDWGTLDHVTLIEHTKKLYKEEPKYTRGTLFEDLEKRALDLYAIAGVYGRASMIANWKSGEAFTKVYLYFMAEKRRVKMSGEKLKDHPLSWCT